MANDEQRICFVCKEKAVSVSVGVVLIEALVFPLLAASKGLPALIVVGR